MAKKKLTAADYPFVDQIQDQMAMTAVRITNDKLASLADSAVPVEGRLNPDERPSPLDQRAAGLLFYSTDFARVFRWTGSAWEDAPGQPERNQVGWFAPAGPPDTILTMAGWASCNGKTVQQTSSDGALKTLQTPTIPAANGLVAYIRL